MRKTPWCSMRNRGVLSSKVKLCFLMGFPAFETFSFRLYFLTFSTAESSVQHDGYEISAADFVMGTDRSQLVVFHGFFFRHPCGPGSEYGSRFYLLTFKGKASTANVYSRLTKHHGENVCREQRAAGVAGVSLLLLQATAVLLYAARPPSNGFSHSRHVSESEEHVSKQGLVAQTL